MNSKFPKQFSNRSGGNCVSRSSGELLKLPRKVQDGRLITGLYLFSFPNFIDIFICTKWNESLTKWKKKNRHDRCAGYSRTENLSQGSVVELGAVLLRDTIGPWARSRGEQSPRDMWTSVKLWLGLIKGLWRAWFSRKWIYQCMFSL